MRISHKNKFIFLSKPKCASESIREKLNKFSDIHSTDSYPYHHHTTAYELRMHFQANGWEWKDYFSFTTVRNPWDMIVSQYHYGKPDLNGLYWWEKQRYGITRNENKLMSFEEWVMSDNIAKSWHMYKIHNNELRKGIWTNDFSLYTLDNYTKDYDNNNLINKVLKVENIDEGIQEVFEHLGINNDHFVKKTNASTREKNYRQYYSEASKKRIEKEFISDIEFGKYIF